MNTSRPLKETNATLEKAIAGLIDEADQLALRGHEVMEDGEQLLRAKARLMGQTTRRYIQHEPAKAVLLAAAGGALVMLFLDLLARSHRNR